jgi:hypothetical protein
MGTGWSYRLAGPYSTTAVMVYSLITGVGRLGELLEQHFCKVLDNGKLEPYSFFVPAIFSGLHLLPHCSNPVAVSTGQSPRRSLTLSLWLSV